MAARGDIEMASVGVFADVSSDSDSEEVRVYCNPKFFFL